MKKPLALVWCFAALLSSIGRAQTTVTNNNNGTTNTVPVYTGSTSLGNSPISISGSNVGIGTASPAAPLHVVGTLRKDFTASVTGGTGYWMLYANDGSANFNEYINSTGTTSPTAVVQGAGFRRLFSPEPTGTTDTFNYQYANTVAAGSPQSWLDYMTVDATHNYLNLMDHGGAVGVGTTSPAYRLDVQGGQINSSGGYCIGGSCITAWPTSSTNTWTGTQTFSGAVNLPTGIWNANGSVGIGTTTPGSQLDISTGGCNYEL